jgi:hypothetical protein
MPLTYVTNYTKTPEWITKITDSRSSLTQSRGGRSADIIPQNVNYLFYLIYSYLANNLLMNLAQINNQIETQDRTGKTEPKPIASFEID